MGTHNFHAAVNATRYELVFLDVGPVYTEDLTRMLVPGADGESLDHLPHLLSPALGSDGIGVGAYIQHHVPELYGTVTGRCDDLVLVDL